MIARTRLRAAILVAAHGACSREPQPAPVTTASVTAAEPMSAVAALDQMDPRMPVPLLPAMAHHQKQNMRDHLVVVQEIVLALASDDFAAAERAASRIASSDAMGQTCSHMGAGAPGFTSAALHFHLTADRIGDAARARDRTGVLDALGSTLQTCTSCHAAWKQQIVDEPTWARATSSEPPTHGMAH